MSEQLISLKKSIKSFLSSVSKQKIILIFTIISCIFGCIHVYQFHHDIFMHLWLSFLFGTLCLFSCSYLTQNFKTLIKLLIQIGTGLLSTGIAFLIFHFVKQKSYAWMYYLGLCFAVSCWTVFIFVPKENNQSYYANIYKYFLFSGLVSFVGFLGAVLLEVAFDELVFSFYNIENLNFCTAIFFFETFNINLFTFYLFEKRQEPSGKAFKIIFMYIVLPVYSLLLLLLYCYLIKAFFLRQLPNGQINWFVSFASAIFLILYFILQEYRCKKVIRVFYRFGALILFPLIVVQFYAFFIRVNAYGYTGWRYSSLLFNIFALTFVIFTFIKNGYFAKFAILVLGLIIIFGSLTPFNLIDFAYNSQYKKLTSVLMKYGMFDGEYLTSYKPEEIGKIITEEDLSLLEGSLRYIRWISEHQTPEWIFDKRINYNYKTQKKVDKPTYKSVTSHVSNYELNIEDYSILKNIDLSEYNRERNESIVIDGLNYNLENDILEYKEQKMEKPLEIIPDDKHKIVLTYIYYSYDIDNKIISDFSIKGYLLEK